MIMNVREILSILNKESVKKKINRIMYYYKTHENGYAIIHSTRYNIDDLLDDENIKKLIYNTKKYGDLLISSLNYINKNHYFNIIFIDTGYVDVAQFTAIKDGMVKDYRYKSVYNIGWLSDNYRDIKSRDYELCQKLRHVWKDMINRCYNPKYKRYYDYGGAGVRVSDDWLCFSTFYNDITGYKGFNRDLLLNGKLSLDKDKLQIDIEKGNRVYSKDTCCLLTSQEQYDYSGSSIINNNRRVSIDYTNVVTKESGTILGVNNLSRLFNLDVAGIYSVLSGRCKTYHNYTFKYSQES